MPLTDAAARNAKPAAKTVRMFDRDGLYLEVSPHHFGGLKQRLQTANTPAGSSARGPQAPPTEPMNGAQAIVSRDSRAPGRAESFERERQAVRGRVDQGDAGGANCPDAGRTAGSGVVLIANCKEQRRPQRIDQTGPRLSILTKR